MAEPHELSALELGEAIRRGELGVVEVVEHHLQRVAKLSATVGAFVTVTRERALEEARAAERTLAGGAETGPLFGVPLAHKDLTSTAGVRTTLGSAVFADWVPETDDFVVGQLRRAGTISLGKTNTPEFGLPCYTEPDVAPPARTPWALDRSAGGSSGGAAAAVAAGLIPFAEASDGGGSIRIPASVCGLVGLKSTRGRVSNGPVAADVTGLGARGPLARTVADAAALLDAMSGSLPGDPFPVGDEVGGFLAAARSPAGRRVIGRTATPVIADSAVHPDCLTAYEQAGELLAELGHEIVDLTLPLPDNLVPDFETVWAVGAAAAPLDPQQEEGLRPLTRWLRERGRATGGPEFLAALSRLRLVARAVVAAMSSVDAVLTPTLASPPVAIGALRDDDDPAADFEAQKRFTPFTALVNLTGQPAISLPLHWTAEGLPIGIQLIGPPAGEAELLRLAAGLEQARPWAGRRPPVW